MVTEPRNQALDFIGRGVDPTIFFETLVQEFFAGKGKKGTDKNYILKYKRWKTFNLLRGGVGLLDGGYVVRREDE